MCIWEEAVEEGVLVGVETRRLSIVEVLHVFVVAKHANRDLLECAPQVDLQEVSKLLINFESDFAISIDIVDC